MYALCMLNIRCIRTLRDLKMCHIAIWFFVAMETDDTDVRSFDVCMLVTICV